MKCTVTGEPYSIFGYKGKQVRDNIHSYDLVNAFHHFYQNPRIGEVYNIGGGRFSNCSMLEAVQLCEEIADKKLDWTYSESNRSGDHIWWISDVDRLKSHYPGWDFKYKVRDILEQIHTKMVERIHET
jgi:CDP-paratose 2-epimerase